MREQSGMCDSVCESDHRQRQTCITGSIPGGLTETLALHKWRSKNATFETPLYLWIHELYYENNIANRLVLSSIAHIQKLIMCICVYQ